MRLAHRLALLVLLILVFQRRASAQDSSRVRPFESLTWRAAGPGAEIAVVDGNPAGTGSFAIALRFRPGGMIPPHFHPNETRVVVVDGEAYVGFGDQVDSTRARPIGPGGYAVIPAGAHHYEAGRTAATIIVYGVGPLTTTMVNPGQRHP